VPLFAALLCACVGRARPRPATPGPPGTVTFFVDLVGPWPVDKTSTEMTYDGVAVQNGARIQSTGSVHTVHSVTDVDIACGLWSSSRVSLRVETVRHFRVHDAATVGFLVIDDGDPLKPLTQRVRTAWLLQGAEFAPLSTPPLPAGCAGLSPIPGAECRVATLLDQARRTKDVAQSLCLNFRLTAIRARLSKAVAGDAEAAGAIWRIEREAIQCTSGNPDLVDETFVTEQDGCAAEEASGL
jgi:hypothetical protein